MRWFVRPRTRKQATRLAAQTDDVFVVIVTRGPLGCTANGLVQAAVARIAYRYDVER